MWNGVSRPRVALRAVTVVPELCHLGRSIQAIESLCIDSRSASGPMLVCF